MRLLLALCTTAVAASVLLPGSVQAQPEPSLQDVQRQVEALYGQAEVSTEKYNGLQEKLQEKQKQLQLINQRIARQQKKLEEMRKTIGAIASAQYRNGGMDTTLQLLLANNPQKFLEQAASLDQLTQQQADQLRRIAASQQQLNSDKRAAAREIAEIEQLRKQMEAHKNEIVGNLNKAQRLLNGLKAEQRRKLQAADRGDDVKYIGAASGDAAIAIEFARRQLGEPYEWGATGPDSWDCSGLTMRAWEQAGVDIPRTSQAQYDALRKVPRSQLRPGDLVFFGYNGEVSHVGIYVGNGRMIHATHPGSTVQLDPVDSMNKPYIGAARP
ncbi:hypothetical protein TH66_12505 [Carbonactinospora thermoautotrophica]|nr:C40 family peptidase [Carbonactinospora thermoautotrophica]KWX03648.1 hypothetical protein TH66_12505 [Carbonactinospora thermoautotrophica]KWX07896.1 hypothetical protein TR74_17230 [Carbonactinospora thermoautotrophica]